MSGLEAAMPILAKFLGYGPEQAGQIRTAIENRLRDAKALLHGGQLVDGTPVPGVQAMTDAMQAMAGQVEAQNLVLAELRNEVRNLRAERSVAPLVATPAENPQPQQRKKGGKSA